ncbi:MAG: hypothetical protein JWL95_2736, partial [Gemmatimonadetes bacterium]|nr:hypothetical protein [Gemmatimonadota bacterium]
RAASAARGARACPIGVATCDRDSTHAEVVRRARGALDQGAWNEAAELWRSALLIDDRSTAHWTALANALTRAGRHREAVAAYQRVIQLDASAKADGMWNIARAYALLGNDKQASRWVELALREGLAGHERDWSDSLFDRYRDDVRVRRLRETGSPASIVDGRRAGMRWL